MANPIRNGGSAFPRPGSDWADGPMSRSFHEGDKGMSLRDYFAAQALRALVAKAPLLDRDGEHGPKFDLSTLNQFRADMAQSAYDYADAMLVERERVR